MSMTSVYAHTPEANIATLIQQLEHADVDVRNQARDVLLEIGEPALPQLMKHALGEAHLAHMHEPLERHLNPDIKTETEKVSTRIRHGCAKILIQMGKTAVPTLIEAWRDDDDFFYRANASRLLTRMGNPALDAFIATLDAEEKTMRSHALFALDDMMEFSQHPRAPETPDLTLAPRKDILRGFIKALKDEDPQIHGLAVGIISGLGENALEAIPALSECLYYGPFFSPFACLTLLTDMGEAGREALTKALDSPLWNFRFGAAYTYGEEFRLTFHSGDTSPLPDAVVPILAEGLKHPGKSTQKDAAGVLRDLKDCGVEEAGKVLDEFFPPAPSQVPLSHFLLRVRYSKNEQIIYGEVVETQFVPRPEIGHPITTDVTLRPIDQIKGKPNPSKNTVTFMTPGGVKPDGSVVEVKGAPVFETGEKVIVFLTTKTGEYPHDGLSTVKYAKLGVVNDRVEIPYANPRFKIVTPGRGSVEKQDVRMVTLPIQFVVKFAKAALIDAESVLPIDQQLNRRAKTATELARYETESTALLHPQNADLNPLEALLDTILTADRHFTTGIKKASTGDWKGAIQDYNKVIKLTPDSGKAYLNRGKSHQKLGHTEAMRKDYQNALQLAAKTNDKNLETQTIEAIMAFIKEP
jgi:HEAT repeat protein